MHARISTFHPEAEKAEAALKAFYAGIAEGNIDPVEPTFAAILKQTVQKRDVAKTALDRALALVADEVTINPVAVTNFASRTREALHDGETAARKMWLSSIVDRIIVGQKTVRIVGRADNFERGLKNHEKGSPPVRSSVQEWCASFTSTSAWRVLALTKTTSPLLSWIRRYLPD